MKKKYDKHKVDSISLKLTENGVRVFQALTTHDALQAENYFSISLDILTRLYNAELIGARDFRRIFAHMLTLREIKTSSFVKMVSANYKKVLPLEIMFGRDEEREKYLSQTGIGERNFKTLIEDGNLKPSCRFSYAN